jgi:hypothetical protein
VGEHEHLTDEELERQKGEPVPHREVMSTLRFPHEPPLPVVGDPPADYSTDPPPGGTT